MPEILDHIEKTTADNYRKEIDQEENVWRTLPFFVAALSLEVAELTQVKDQLIGLPVAAAWVAGILGVIAALATIVAIGFLIGSIAMADFKYVSREPELVEYADQLQAAEDGNTIAPGVGLIELKKLLARQYAATTDNNRSINQRRVKLRTIAGTATLLSLLASLLLGAVTVSTQVWNNGLAHAKDAHVTSSGGQIRKDGSRPGEAKDSGTTKNPGGS